MNNLLDFYCKEIITIILLENEINIENISNRTNLSIRQVNYRLDLISSILLEKFSINIYLKSIKSLDKITYRALKEVSESNNFQNFSKEERKFFILLSITGNKDYLSLNDLIYFLSSSRSTTINDVKELKNELDELNISIISSKSNGYYLKKHDVYALNFIVSKIINSSINYKRVTNYYLTINKSFNAQKIKEILISLSNSFDIDFVGCRLDEFVCIINLILYWNSFTDVSNINYSEIFNINDFIEYQFIQNIIDELHINVSDDIKKYLCAWIVGISVGNANLDTPDRKLVTDLVSQIMTKFQNLGFLTYDNYVKTFNQLYNHFRPAFIRMIYHIPISNPLTQQIKENYKDIFVLVKESLKPLINIFNITISDDEIAYLTMHFQTFFSNDNNDNTQGVKCAIICDAGIGTSVMIKTQLLELFPNFTFIPLSYKSIDDLYNFNDNFDILFTSIYDLAIGVENLPIFYTPALLNQRDKENLVTKVNAYLGNVNSTSQFIIHEIMNIISKFAIISSKQNLKDELINLLSNYNFNKTEITFKLSDMLKANFIIKRKSVKNWKDAIIQSAKPLLDHNYIQESYIESIIESITTQGPYVVICKGVALPHANPNNGVNKNGLTLLILDEPIEFHNIEFDPIKYIFCLSAVDNTKHLSAIASLVSLLNNKEFYDILDNKNELEIWDYIKNNE